MCQYTIECVYTPYYYIFTTLSDRDQTAFALLLPIMKLIMRNFFARTVPHLSDRMPEIIVFNIEAFSAFFVSYCMQKSPSIWTTLELMVVDIVMNILSVCEMEVACHGLQDLEKKIVSGRAHSNTE